MVLANRSGNGGMNNLTYANATAAQINYRGTYNATLAYNLFVGMPYWSYLGNTVCQIVAGSPMDLSSTPSKRARWKFSGFNSTWGFLYPRGITVDIGANQPGFYTYHAVNNFSLTTYDNDQDTYGANCSTLYNNNPWWYGACWDGNYFAGGGGYADAPYWSGSGGDYYSYGAIFLSFTDV
jgi:hypothetical protein